EEERAICRQNGLGEPQPELRQVVSLQEVLEARRLVRRVYMDEKIENYILDIVFASRSPDRYGLARLKPLIACGGSPRASISLARAAMAHAFLHKRGFVMPDDVREICTDVLRHRIGLTYEAEAENVGVDDLIAEILRAVPVP